MQPTQGNFYFLDSTFYTLFPDANLMQNGINPSSDDRACLFSFFDKKTNMYWFIPISSKVDKYKKIFNMKIQKRSICDTIVFANVLGAEKAILIQNMFPAPASFIKNEYISNKTSVKLEKHKEAEILNKAKKVLSLHIQKKAKIMLTDVDSIIKHFNP
ncbi:MAG: type III toxin-antitoxin system CptIN family toxin [Cetobacterium sp.]